MYVNTALARPLSPPWDAPKVQAQPPSRSEASPPESEGRASQRGNRDSAGAASRQSKSSPFREKEELPCTVGRSSEF